MVPSFLCIKTELCPFWDYNEVNIQGVHCMSLCKAGVSAELVDACALYNNVRSFII